MAKPYPEALSVLLAETGHTSPLGTVPTLLPACFITDESTHYFAVTPLSHAPKLGYAPPSHAEGLADGIGGPARNWLGRVGSVLSVARVTALSSIPPLPHAEGGSRPRSKVLASGLVWT